MPASSSSPATSRRRATSRSSGRSKLAKYLPEFGWRPTVLTGARATSGLPEDPQLLDQVAGVEIIRARAPEFSCSTAGGAARGRGSAAPATRAACTRRRGSFPTRRCSGIRSRCGPRCAGPAAARWDVIVATSYPPTAILIAHTIASRLRDPYVADFRDSWTTYHHAPRRPARLAELERRLEARMIRDAAAVVAVDPRMVEHAFARIAPADRPPVHVIQNGYDEDDFRGVGAALSSHRSRSSTPASCVARRAPSGRRCRTPCASDRSCADDCTLADRVRGPARGLRPGGATRGRYGAPGPPGPAARGDLLHARRRPAARGRVRVDHAVEDAAVPAGGRPILAFLDEGGMIRDVLHLMPQAYLVGRDEPDRIGDLIASRPPAPRDRPAEPNSVVVMLLSPRDRPPIRDGARCRVEAPDRHGRSSEGRARRRLARRSPAVEDLPCRSRGTPIRTASCGDTRSDALVTSTANPASASRST